MGPTFTLFIDNGNTATADQVLCPVNGVIRTVILTVGGTVAMNLRSFLTTTPTQPAAGNVLTAMAANSTISGDGSSNSISLSDLNLPVRSGQALYLHNMDTAPVCNAVVVIELGR